MWNLHGGTVFGIATTATLSIVGGVLLHDTGQRIVSTLFLVVMAISTLLAVATIVRFVRNQRRSEMHTAITEARDAWHDAHKRSSVFSGTNS